MGYALVIGGKGGRRSAAAREAAAALAAAGLRVGGFTQRTLEDERGHKTVLAERLEDGRRITLAESTAQPAEAGGSCALAFDPAALAEVRTWVEAAARDAAVLVVDGLGKLELGGGGNRAAIAQALHAAPLVVLALREDQLAYALEALALEDEPLAAYSDGEGAGALRDFVAALAVAARSP
ncbi:MAG: DUF2478 domain-containing protein [Anaeromyxobacteraceae bacterium]